MRAFLISYACEQGCVRGGLQTAVDPVTLPTLLGAQRCLRSAELRFFTGLEGGNHIAIAAIAIDARGREGKGAPVGNLLWLPDEHEVLELALTIIDA